MHLTQLIQLVRKSCARVGFTVRSLPCSAAFCGFRNKQLDARYRKARSEILNIKYNMFAYVSIETRLSPIDLTDRKLVILF